MFRRTLLQAGLQWLDGLAADPKDAPAPGQASPTHGVKTDPTTGERYLRLPVPDPALLRTLADRLIEVLQRRG